MSKASLAALTLLALAAACGRSALTNLDPADGADAGGPAPPDAACADAGGTDAGALAAIPFGVYTRCSSAVTVAGSTAVGGDGTVSLAATGGVLNLEIGKGFVAFRPGTLAFLPITASAAVVAPGQSYPVANVSCATATATVGALVFEGGRLLVSLVGEGCGRPLSGGLSCAVPDDPTDTLAPPPLPCSPAGAPACGCAPPEFAIGTYDPCTATVPGFGSGTLTVAQGPDGVTATLQGAKTVARTDATLRFAPITRTTAAIVPGQKLEVFAPGAFIPATPDTMVITSGTLVVHGSMVFVFLSGTDDFGVEVREDFHCGAAN